MRLLLLILFCTYVSSVKEFTFNNEVRRTTKSREVNGENAFFDPETGKFKRFRPSSNKNKEDLELVNRARLNSVKARNDPETKPVLSKVLKKRKITRKPVNRLDYIINI